MSSVLTQAELKKWLNYDPLTGVFTWAKPSHNRIVGAVAGSLNLGYIRIKLNYKSYKAHRLAWLFMTGEFPQQKIDHKDTDKANNIWLNLREATTKQNMQNTGIPKNNTSGYKGVAWNSNANKFKVTIQVDGKAKHLGYFSDPKEGSIVYQKVAKATRGEYHFQG